MTDVKTGLRARREQLGLSREQLARKIGCSTAMISHFELLPTPEMAQRLADALDCEPADLFEQRGNR